ncbi:MAG: chromosomal replication initiator DnaA [Pseudomonadota bacterium]
MAQMVMDMPRRQAQGREDFMVSSSNATAMALLEGWPDWPDRRLALAGPEGSGKSHMAAIWAAEVGARVLPARALRAEAAGGLAEAPLVIEDADRGVDEAALFHLMNACAGAGQGLLLTGRAVPSDWDVALPDLASRLSAVTPAVLEDPDDALLSVVLLKLFADRQLRVKPALIGWLLPRMERSHAAAAALVARLDAAALERGVDVNVALARTVMDADAAGS